MKKNGLLILFLMTVIRLFGQINDVPIVIVAPFDLRGVDETDGEVLYELLQSSLASEDMFKVVDRSSLTKIQQQMDFQKSDWSDSEKIAQLGEALNADTVVTCQLSNIREKYMIAIYMIDVKTTEIMSAAPVYFIEDFMKLIDMMSFFANALAFNYGINGLPYYIGDRGTGGGTIFYVSKNGFRIYNDTKIYHYLECSDLFKHIPWCPARWETYLKDRCCFYSELLTKTNFGYGKYNTERIINGRHRHGRVTPDNCAAYKCYKYFTSTSKAGEWWLPSKDELNLIYVNLKLKGLLTVNYHVDYYWSSSDVQDDRAEVWCKDFLDEFTDKVDKGNYMSVRAVRAF